MKNLFQLSGLAIFACLLFINCKKDTEISIVPEPEKEKEEESLGDLNKNAAEYVENTTDYSLFFQAMVKANMIDSLKNENQQFTIFVPSNQAFQKLLAENDAFDTVDDISASTWALLMKYHISNTGKVTAEKFEHNLAIQVLYQDRSIYIKMPDSDTRQVTTGGFSIATIEATDALTKNAVIHLIDKVLVP